MRGLPDVAQPVRPRKQAEHVVEAAVFLEDDDDVTDFRQRIISRKRGGGGRVRGSEPTGDEASHAERANAMRVHGAVHQVLSTATIGTSNLVRNEWSVTTSAGRLILPRPIRWRSPSARAR